MLWKKFKNENKQRAISQKLSMQELRFICTALPLDEMYYLISLANSFEDMHRTKFKYENKQRAITKQEGHDGPESVSPQNEFYLLYYYCSN